MADGNPANPVARRANTSISAGKQTSPWREKAPLLHVIWSPAIPANERPENIDRTFFIPLAEFLAHDNYDPRHLEELINVIGIPAHLMRSLMGPKEPALAASRGFTLEAYVKWALARFANSLPPYTFVFAEQRMEILRKSGAHVEIRAWGSATFFDKPKGGNTITEIDCLGEFFSGGEFDPLVFEITNADDRELSFYNIGDKTRAKARLVTELYEGYDPYVCKVQPSWKLEKTGLYAIPGQHRKIIIPARKELEESAEKICERGPNSNRIYPLSSP
jgi:hypothetical protein